MSEYDSTNSGVFFKPHEDQTLFGQGKLDIDGKERRIVVVRERLTRDGAFVPVVYERLGPLFDNDKKGNEKAPDRSGPMDNYESKRMAVWQGEKDGRKYFSMKVSERQNEGGSSDDGGMSRTSQELDDEIPF